MAATLTAVQPSSLLVLQRSQFETLLGHAPFARSIGQTSDACSGFRALLDAWGGRASEPAEITEARAYVADSCQPQNPGR